MASTQRVQVQGGVTWTVVDGDGHVIGPVEEYLEFARQSEYSPNTVRSYARSLALWSTHLEQHRRGWGAVVLADFGSFLQALRAGEVGSGVVSLRPARRVADATVAARVRPVMSFYRFHAAVGVKTASFLCEQAHARPGRYLPFLEHVARRQGRQRSRVRVRVQPREVPVLTPGQVDALVAAEREFLRFKKINTVGRPLTMDQGDLYDVLQLDNRADRVLPNGWCTLPPKQVCNRGNACLSCDKFVTDASHATELRRQLTETDRLVDQRKAAFLTRYGTPMDDDNVWLHGCQTEAQSLRQILLAIQDVTDTSSALRGAGVTDRHQPTDRTCQKDDPE